jgi:predicted Fe-Mo cluster-binding NifX family protein
MKTALPATERSLKANLDARFGRAPFFLIYDTATDQSDWVPNRQNMLARQGAGIQSAQTILDQGVEAVVSVHLGPKAFRVLEQAGVKLYQGTVKPLQKIIEEIKSDKLEPITGANVNGHW